MARFYRRGVSKMKFLPAVAGASPTRGEITAGVDISPQVADIGGFALTNSPIPTPDLATAFNSQIAGSDEASDSSVTMYDDNASAALRTAMAKGTAGYMVLFPYGDVATKRCEVWPVTSTGVNDQWTTGAEAAKYLSSFAVTSTPNQTATVPA